jgi:general secretion pathway protein C
MTARALAFFVWAAVAASVMFWGLRLVVGAPRAPAHTSAVNVQAAANGDLSRLLGREPVVAAAPVQAEASNRFRLVGVVAPKVASTGEGLALISVDGKPARHYRVGTAVDGGTMLLSVSARGAELGPSGGPAIATLNLPPPPTAATGVLPSATNAEAPAAPPIMRPPQPAQVLDPTRMQPMPIPGQMRSPVPGETPSSPTPQDIPPQVLPAPR